jgi:hypothetical protein
MAYQVHLDLRGHQNNKEYGPSQIAEILGTDDYVAQMIFSETTNKNTSKIISNYNF